MQGRRDGDAVWHRDFDGAEAEMSTVRAWLSRPGRRCSLLGGEYSKLQVGNVCRLSLQRVRSESSMVGVICK
ncbi:hypothetical protein GJ744_006822 [Endocarpon pusillum]|uniref:Uncharacterized protein n=1 Tax=Endocarpon pusillum TaxID=364733 RepID=A0A8H7E818_9EURO|nr:hypothetical protein GJ744_006822 [Endocarpon pusillum]